MMKKLMLLFLIGAVGLCSSCEKEDNNDLACEDADCLFVLEEASGTVVLMNCFERLAIQTESPDADSIFIYGLPDQDLPVALNEAGTKVIFSAAYRGNQIDPTFPDPTIGPETIYQIKLVDIKAAP